MIPRFRIAVLFALCFAILLSGCALLEKQRLPFSAQDEATRWANSIAGLSGMEQGLRAQAVLKNPASSPALKNRALSIAASRPGNQGYASRKELSSLYGAATAEQRAGWETMYWRDLDGMDSDSLKKVALAVSSKQETVFPWNLVKLKAALRSLLPDSSAVIARLSNPLLYAAPAALGIAAPPQGLQATSVAIVVPQTGSAAAIGKQLAEGALAAADALRMTGKAVDVRIIDSGLPNWQQAVQSLPAQFTMVGGPLLPSRYTELKAAARGRAVFSFTSSLPAGEEGVHAWRFFASQEDQIDAVLDAAENLGISSFGIFSPEDSWSRRMSGLFMQKATARGFAVTSGSYTAGKMSAWSKEAGTFVKTQVGAQRGSIPEATADFRAIFLPDSWKNMAMIVSCLHYNGAQDRLMLGTSLWEQNLGPNSHSNAAAFALTIFPGVWDSHSTTAGAEAFKHAIAARNAIANDWSSLGFDFVSMAAALNLQPGWNALNVNRALNSRPNVEWAGAPIFWDESGKASRRLLLFQPAATGHIPADMQTLKERLKESSISAQEAPAAQQQPVNFEQLIHSMSKD